jgi:hypothetical protein
MPFIHTLSHLNTYPSHTFHCTHFSIHIFFHLHNFSPLHLFLQMPFTPSSTHFLNLYTCHSHTFHPHTFPFAYPTLPPHFFHSHTFPYVISFHPYFPPTPTIPACCMHHMSPRFFPNEPTPSLSLFFKIFLGFHID